MNTMMNDEPPVDGVKTKRASGVRSVRKCDQPGYWKEYSMKRRRAKGIMPKVKISEEEAYRRHQLIMKRYYEKNKEIRRVRSAAYRAANPGICRAGSSRRRAKHRNALHPMSDRAKEAAIMGRAKGMTMFTGIVHHVDHIIPLKSGGFHHHDNLQVVTRRINLTKNGDPFFEAKGIKSWREVPRHLWPESVAGTYRAIMVVEKLFAA